MHTPARQVLCYDQAASLYLAYAMALCTSTFDGKITLQRMIMGERALERSCLLYGTLGNWEQVDETFGAYSACIQQTLDEKWEPDETLLQIVKYAKQRISCPHQEQYVVPEETHQLPDHEADHACSLYFEE